MERFQNNLIIKDLSKKMVFLTGPRQVGKTYLAKQILKNFKSPVYLNYDQVTHRDIIHKQDWLQETDLLVLDELHKMKDWKNFLKGIYDTKPPHLQILVTGSARLETFDKIGDSLAGRYFLHRLLPLSPAELNQLGKPIHLEDLLKKGGFPEPYFSENLLEAERWRLQYSNSLLSTDVFDFDKIQNISAIRNLFELLRHRVGSTISYQSLAEDLAISPHTVKKYIEILEALYVIFRITPFSSNIARSLLKEPKIYFFDNGLIHDKGAQLENLVAVCLLKHVYATIDYRAENYALHYIRTKDEKEIDFVLVKDHKVEKIIEVKNKNHDISKSLYQFHKKYSFPAVQVVKELTTERNVEGISVINLLNFLKELYL